MSEGRGGGGVPIAGRGLPPPHAMIGIAAARRRDGRTAHTVLERAGKDGRRPACVLR